jgi:hypothetical protein
MPNNVRLKAFVNVAIMEFKFSTCICVYGETPQTLMPKAVAQPGHLEIAILGHGGCHHALTQRPCCMTTQHVITFHMVRWFHVLVE